MSGPQTENPKPNCPTCTRCGKQTEFVTSILDPKVDYTVRVFRCQCGDLSWTSEREQAL